jgi:hypothetical protein
MNECDWDVKSTTPDLAALQLSECLPVRPVGFKQEENFPTPSKSKGMPSNFSSPDSINALRSETETIFRGGNIFNNFSHEITRRSIFSIGGSTVALM